MNNQQKRPTPLFGVSLTPVAQGAEKVLHLSQVADTSGLDLLAIQDHPYNPTFLDTWTLLSLIGGQTRQIRLVAGVSPIALRPPAMLAKAAASLDVLTGGRVEMGVGTGAYWDAIESFGGPRRTPGEAVAALREGIAIMRLLWQDQDGSAVSYDGHSYRLRGAQAGPAPRHAIRIWVGAVGPKMLQVVGEVADGWFAPLATYISPEQVAASNTIIDAAAQAAGRDPGSIRRISNLPGVVLASAQAGARSMRGTRAGVTVGPPQRWVETLLSSFHDVGMDTFVFWPGAGNEEQQIRLFAEEVVPAVRAQLSGSAPRAGGFSFPEEEQKESMQ
jgi:alkanesulfonate monooxygenase SsuD/methylene tetrahydromethanopterin reductase-like flavin-dependent oxidoreductase (luciferase family)